MNAARFARTMRQQLMPSSSMLYTDYAKTKVKPAVDSALISTTLAMDMGNS